MSEHAKWLYLAAGLIVGAAATLAIDRFPGGRGGKDSLEFSYREGRTYMVKRVIDGDTIVVEPGIRLRYAGINTPETYKFVDEAQPFAREAAEANKRLVAGRAVRVIPAPARFDHLGRLLASVEVQEPETGLWVDVEEELLKAGLARRMYDGGALHNELRLKRAEEGARSAGLGLWPGVGGKAAREPKPSESRSPSPKSDAPNEERRTSD